MQRAGILPGSVVLVAIASARIHPAANRPRSPMNLLDQSNPTPASQKTSPIRRSNDGNQASTDCRTAAAFRGSHVHPSSRTIRRGTFRRSAVDARG